MAARPERALVVPAMDVGAWISPLWGLGSLWLLGDGAARLLRPSGVVVSRGAAEAVGTRILLSLALIPFLCLVMDLTSIPITRLTLFLAMTSVFLASIVLQRTRPVAGRVVPHRNERSPGEGDVRGDARSRGEGDVRGEARAPAAGGSRALEVRKVLRSPAALVLILALVTVVLASALQTSLYPPRSYDALVGWDLVGKVMAYEGKVRSSIFTNLQFNAQCAYAPFTALNQGYWYLFFPSAPRFWVPLVTAGFCLVMWSRANRWTRSPTAAGLSTFLVFLPPTLTYQLTVGQTDLPAMVYTTLAFFFAAEALRGSAGVAPIAFYSLIATTVRSEGVLFAMALTLIGLVAGKQRWRWTWIFAASAAFFAFWNLFIVRFLIGYDPGEYFRRTIDFDPARMAEVVQRAVTILATHSFYGELNWLLVLFLILWVLGRWGIRQDWFRDDEGSRIAALLIPISIVSFVCYLPFFYQWNPELNPLWSMEHTFKRGVFRFIPSLIVATVATPPVLRLLRKCEPRTAGPARVDAVVEEEPA